MGQTWWFVARASGIVAWALLTTSVLWGLMLSTKVRPPRVRPAWTLDLHRFLGGTAAIFTGLHIGSVFLDSYVHFGPREILVPFASTWKPAAVALGIVSLYLLLAVELTSLAKRRLPHRLWRRVHVLSLPLFFLATLHFVTAGTDAHGMLVLSAVLAATLAVVAGVALRIRQATRPAPARVPRVPSPVPVLPDPVRT
ncbi:MAG TPA: ferric reductase-like transmembrane domain-containing protein [Acidimicrobiales bacterium]|nr:ferric reductase-like transmembrane domain-containing protein [Acidimicrobiales bacterium]